MYAGRVACCPLMSRGEIANGQTDRPTDGRQTVTLRFPLDATSVKTASHYMIEYTESTCLSCRRRTRATRCVTPSCRKRRWTLSGIDGRWSKVVGNICGDRRAGVKTSKLAFGTKFQREAPLCLEICEFPSNTSRIASVPKVSCRICSAVLTEQRPVTDGQTLDHSIALRG